MLGYRVNDRREDVQHEDHGRHQAWSEKDRCWTGSPLTQKPRAERRSGGGVWRELSRNVAWQRQGRPQTAFTCLGQRTERGEGGVNRHSTLLPKHTRILLTAHRWTPYECAISIFDLFGVFYKYHACCQVDKSASERLFGLLISETLYVCGPFSTITLSFCLLEIFASEWVYSCQKQIILVTPLLPPPSVPNSTFSCFHEDLIRFHCSYHNKNLCTSYSRGKWFTGVFEWTGSSCVRFRVTCEDVKLEF